MTGIDVKSIMTQAKAMQTHMESAQQELKSTMVIGTSGGGLVEAHLNGLYQAIKTKISPKTLLGEVEVLEDLVTAAWNDAVQKIERIIKGKMSKIASEFEGKSGL